MIGIGGQPLEDVIQRRKDLPRLSLRLPRNDLRRSFFQLGGPLSFPAMIGKGNQQVFNLNPRCILPVRMCVCEAGQAVGDSVRPQQFKPLLLMQVAGLNQFLGADSLPNVMCRCSEQYTFPVKGEIRKRRPNFVHKFAGNIVNQCQMRDEARG